MTRTPQAKGLPVNREPFAEFFHTFLGVELHDAESEVRRRVTCVQGSD